MKPRAVPAMIAMIGIFVLSACSSEIQTSSGRAYLDKYPAPAVATGADAANTDDLAGETFDEKLRRVAAVEPTLRFPARIGLARIENGRLSAIPSRESKAWMQAAARMDSGFGQFVPLSRLVVEMVAGPTVVRSTHRHWGSPEVMVRRTMERIRLGAARQHLDAVLVYEVYGSSAQNGNILSTLNFTIIGAFLLPGEEIRAKGFASALLIDVRNGYPYGTARKVVEAAEITTPAGSNDVRRAVQRVTMTQSAVALVPEVEAMFRKLRTALARLDTVAAPSSPVTR